MQHTLALEPGERMPKRVLTPLLVLNGAYLVTLVTLGPVYGWVTMVLIGAVVSAANIIAINRFNRSRGA